MGIDLGGTDFRYSVFEVSNGQVSGAALFKDTIPTEKGPDGLKRIMAQAHEKAINATSGYDIIAIGLCSPGRPLSIPEAGPQAFVIAPGSAANLEINPGELNGVNMQKLLQDAAPNVPLYISNDAIVQMQAMLVEVTRKIGSTNFLGKKVGYIGLGSGLGGGFANVSKRGTISPQTDGHIYDVLLSMPEDIEWLHKKNETLPNGSKFQFHPGGSIRAEDILSGTSFSKMTGQPGTDFKNPESAETVRPVLECMGRGLAELVIKIYDGELKKISADADWPAADLQEIKGTHTFLMGGGMANNPFLMKIIGRTAQDKLREEGLKNVKFVSIADKEVTLAAANLVPSKLLQNSLQL